jgi:hypothetical protein
MNLQTLREEKRSYKGLVSVVSLIEKSFKDIKDYKTQFTPELAMEFIRELNHKENKSLVVISNNRLFTLPIYCINRVLYSTDLDSNNTIDNIIANMSLSKAIDDSIYGSSVIENIKNIYVVEDQTEIYKLQAIELERLKNIKAKEYSEILESKTKEITDFNTYIADTIKYGTTNKSEIRQLKAVEVIRNTKATNKEVLDAILQVV